MSEAHNIYTGVITSIKDRGYQSLDLSLKGRNEHFVLCAGDDPRISKGDKVTLAGKPMINDRVICHAFRNQETGECFSPREGSVLRYAFLLLIALPFAALAIYGPDWLQTLGLVCASAFALSFAYFCSVVFRANKTTRTHSQLVEDNDPV